MTPQLEKTLAEHCGAVVMGMKPAALFTLGKTGGDIRAAEDLLGEHGITTVVLRHSKERVLFLAYEPALLQQALRHSVAQKWLHQMGYPIDDELDTMLGYLKIRFAGGECFPHEIGFFLGYPPCDVVGFMFHGGKRYKHCCMWKVYGDVEKAKNLCEEFNLCRHICKQHIEAGGRFEALPGLVGVTIAE